MKLPVDSNTANPTGISDFDGFQAASLDANRWDSKVEVGSTAISITSGELKFLNNGSGMAGISYLPTKQSFGKVWRISADLRLNSFTGTHGDISLVLFKDADNFVKFGPYKSSAGTNDNAYLRWTIDGVAQTAQSLAGRVIDTASNHTYTLAVLNNLILVFYDGDYKYAMSFPSMIDYSVRIEGGTWDNTDTIDARADDIDITNSFDALQMAIGLMCDEIGTMVTDIYKRIPGMELDIDYIRDNLGTFSPTITDISGTLTLANTTPVALEFGTATYGDHFSINLMADLGGADINHCFLFDASAGTYTDLSAVANTLKTGTVPVVPAGGSGVGDIIYFGNHVRFNRLDVYLEDGVSNDSTASPNTFVWEYYNGATWAALTVTDGTVNVAQAFGKSGKVTFSDVISQATVNGETAYWIRARVSAAGTSKPVASHLQCSEVAASGFDSVAEFLSTIYVDIYRKINGTYSALPSDTMPFIQCILDRNIDISTFECWSDTRIVFSLSASPVSSVSLPYAGYVQTL